MDLKTLEPKALWNYFYEITQIPRPSKKEEKIIAYLQQFGEKHNLSSKTDKAGNVLIYKPATKGYEGKDAVVLQAHMDMVGESNVPFDFDTEPIQAYIDGDWVKAKDTTLGADNGIGMAMMLAILASDEIPHPALECLFTVDEETGLSGAFALEKNFITGKTLINLDSEDDGEIFIGCAGGVDTVGQIEFKPDKAPEGYFAFEVSIKGLKGGHSGDDIDKGLGNANKILNRFLWKVNKETDLRLHSFDGGKQRNAIPREAVAVGCIPYCDKEKLRVLFNLFVSDVEGEKGKVEPKMKLSLSSGDMPENVMDKKTSDALLNTLYACPHGVIAMSIDMPGLVETSTNLASVKMKEKNIVEITTSQRSSIESSKYDIACQVESVLLLGGAEVKHGDGYPGWKPNLNSAILKKAEESYKKLFDADAKVRAIHAGLECGLFLEKYPYLDMISIGPAMRGVHSPDEMLSISSTQKCFTWLCDILKR
ncbi:aminoacyl-histidine dipeptidase [Paludibacter sp. 221]|uniref:aminoacyl-histidine dipeptidase n=1 Tax=Paludibacter sp. 221 TaxID=2302939 RepID=UPI0013D7710B|nr:aminoacyl-histidine dipeptidase [Paludibacter sp. 221]NDV45847.1 aminoacyl-histidine dipeptidase [Paludibacter sp. 221]